MAKFISTGDKERKLNLKRNKFLEMVRKFPGISRQSIAEALRISTFNISHLTRDLIEEKIILETDDLKEESQGQGRPSKPLVLNGAYDYFAGIDLEASCWRMVILDFQGKPVFEHSATFVESNDRQGYIDQLNKNLKDGIHESGNLWKKVSCIGFGAPGSLEEDSGTILRFEILKNFKDIPIYEMYHKIGKKDILISDNISNLAIYDHWNRPEVSDKTVLHFAIRSGIKVVLMHNDQLYIGKNNYSGEVGFLPLHMDDPKSPTLHSAIAQKSLKQKLDVSPDFWLGKPDAIEKAFSNSKNSVHLELFVKAFSAGLKSMIYLYDPDEIIVHSSLFTEHNLLWEELQTEFEKQMKERTFSPPNLYPSEAPANSAAIGAGLRAMERQYPTQ
jgi:predicted NBD/HSP70 family sugar kinase